jgi:(2R)-3-sulfolactate dehydrogenase (NADP+)
MEETQRFTLQEGLSLARQACLAAGASLCMAVSLAEATVSAEACGQTSVGFRHLLDYLAGLVEGRIDGAAEPVISSPASALVQVDARGGIAQLGFDRAFGELCRRTLDHGIAAFAQKNSYSTGELGYYVRRLAEAGLLAVAMSNGPPLMAPAGVKRAVYSTNPLAFAAPIAAGPSVLLDQASSATAFVNVRDAAERGALLPEGWAVDAEGEPTVDPARALRGHLLIFGGQRGANIALMIEIMAAGLTGANWSIDAPAFQAGDRSPGAGLLVIAVAPRLLDPEFGERLQQHMRRLAEHGVHIPGRSKAERESLAASRGFSLPVRLVRQIEAFGSGPEQGQAR